MDSTSRIDTSTRFTLELRNRRPNVADDGQQDLFAQALGQQLAKNHDETAARYSVTKLRTADRTANASATASPSPRDPQPTDTAPANFVSRETLSGKKPNPAGQNTTGKTLATGTKPSANAKATAPKTAPAGDAANTAPDETGATQTAAAADGTAAPVAPADETKAIATDKATDQGTQVVDPAVPAPSPEPAQPTATVAPVPAAAPAVPVVQATVLLLTGVPVAEDGTTADPVAADPQALAALLGKLQATQTAAAAPKTPATATAEQNDPSAIDDTLHPETIGQAKPSESASTDRAISSTATKSKPKTTGQNAALRGETDAIVKPATPPQASLTALAQANTGTGRGITLPEGMSVNEDGEIGASDLEFSAWSEQLGPGFANGTVRGANWQQSAFLAQLKQNVQLMQPHEQVAVQIQRAAQNGVGRLTVDLQPAELGRVEIKMSVDKDKNVTASVVVDRPATLDLLQRDARNLERILQDAGLQTDSGSLSFSLRNSGGDAQGQNQGGGAGTGNRGENGGDAAATATAATRPTVVATADGYVDLET